MNKSLNQVENIALKGFIPHLEEQILRAEISQEDADFKACVFLQRCHDKAHIRAISPIGERWLRLTPQELIEAKTQEIEDLRQDIQKFSRHGRAALEDRAIYLESQVKVLRSLIS